MSERIQDEWFDTRSLNRAGVSVVNLHQRFITFAAAGEQVLSLNLSIVNAVQKNVVSTFAERQLASGGFCFTEGYKHIAFAEINVLSANAARFFGSHSGFKHQHSN